MTYLAVEDRLHVHLAREIELLRGRFRPFVPFLEDLSEPNRVDLYELLQRT